MDQNIHNWINTGLIGLVLIFLLVGGLSQPDERLSGTRFPNGISADSTSPSSGEVRGTTLTTTGAVTLGGAATLSSTLAVTGASTLSGEVTLLEGSEAVAADNTIALAESATTYYLSGAAATSTLPAVATATSSVFRFVVSASVTGDLHIASAEGDNIEGALIVAGAVVDCDAVDRIDIIADGENLGDFVELRSDGQKWFISQSGALTAAKMTCSEGI